MGLHDRAAKQAETKAGSGRPSVEHRRRVDAVRPEAEALPAASVTAPRIPVEQLAGRVFSMLIGCRENAGALARVGVTEEQAGHLKKLVFALLSAQSLLEEARRGEGRGAPPAQVEAASGLRNRLYALTEAEADEMRECAEFAFRGDDGDERISWFRGSHRSRWRRSSGGSRARLGEAVELVRR
ncbi:MAG: hypothetical protein R6V85_17230 [Polyangia bacterium]